MTLNSLDGRNREFEKDIANFEAPVDFPMPVRSPDKFCNPFHLNIYFE